ncbi:hypothetical protein CFELI_01890 [Corynebacterium felinum]|uniref:Uncharacterized protein n=1 Tax=Corynebacterium felinum TaxID=131318 RepID=A0ABU2B7R9_9CORY|nr:hypothetical protein [Corynebacterium felinum]WJY94021.1 hypothetical protein CFELI_01890 [Corynebacterium felinum]
MDKLTKLLGVLLVAFSVMMLVGHLTQTLKYWWVALLITFLLYIPEIVSFFSRNPIREDNEVS